MTGKDKYRRWLIVSLLLTLGSSVLVRLINPISNRSIYDIVLVWGITPIFCTIGLVAVYLISKLNRWGQALSTFNHILYIGITYMSGYFGEMIFCAVFTLPMGVISFLNWSKKSDKPSEAIRVLPVQFKLLITILIITFAIIVAIGLDYINNLYSFSFGGNSAVYGYLQSLTGLRLMGPLVDATSIAIRTVATILMALLFLEQWRLWTVVNIISVGLWLVVAVMEPSNVAWALPILISRLAYLYNSIYTEVDWKESKGL